MALTRGLEAEACPYCGEPEVADLLEVWGREFMLDTCCVGAYEAAVDELNRSERQAAAWLSSLPMSKGLWPGRGSGSLRRVVDSGAGLVLDWNLRIQQVTFRAACDFVTTHHRHSAAPVGWRFGAGVYNASDLLGVVMVGRPVARGFDPRRVVEVTRLCMADSALAWNGCSMLYGWAAREAQGRGYELIVTYVRADESAASVKAAGWVAAGEVRGRQWNSRTRPRALREAVDRMRWHRVLNSSLYGGASCLTTS